MYFFGLKKDSLLCEFINIVNIFYFPLSMLLFGAYNNDKINDKLITKIFLLYEVIFVVSSIFNLNLYDNMFISIILLILGGIALNYINNSKSFILKIVSYILLFLCVYYSNTVIMYLGTIIILLFILIRYIRYSRIFKVDKWQKRNIVISIFIIALLIGLCPVMKITHTIKDNKIYTVNNIVKYTGYDSKLEVLGRVNNKFTSGKVENYIYGLGKYNLNIIDNINIDIFDIFFGVGLFGVVVYILMILYNTRFHGLKDKYNFAFSLAIILSLVGTVLINPSITIYISLLYLLSKNSLTLDKQRILLVSNNYPSKKYKQYGSFIKNTEDVLKDHGFIVDKVVITKQDNIICKLFAYIRMNLMVILKGIFNNYDYIYAHYVSHTGFAPIFVKKTSANTKIVFNAHGYDVASDSENSKNVRRSKKYLKYAYKVVVPSEYFKEVMINDYKINKNKVFIYPSGGVDTNLFKKIDKKEAKKNAKLSNKYNYIGYVSKLEKNKGYDVFLKAISLLKDKKELKNYKYLVVGSGSEEDKFKEIVKSLELEDYLEVRNLVSQEELINIYNSLDIFVFPTYTKSESLGLVGLEAMSSEVLVIASNMYGPTSYIVDNKNGLFFEKENSEDLSKKIIKVLNMKEEELNKIRTKARETAIKYDSFKTRNQILEVFK
jgi:glycosyltransferase involved in cell wall biosynthesis